MKVNFDIESYKTRFLGGARSYLFFCLFQFPTGGEPTDQLRNKLTGMVGKTVGSTELTRIAGDTYDFTKKALTIFGLGSQYDIMTYLVKSTTLPSESFEEKQIDWQGSVFKVAGDRTYDDWTVTFNIDNQGLILEKFTKWQNMIQNPRTNARASSNEYMADQAVHLIDYTGNSIKGYKLYGAWPKSVSQVALDYSANEIAQLEVTFSYQYHIVGATSDGFKSEIIKRGAQKIMSTASGAGLPNLPVSW